MRACVCHVCVLACVRVCARRVSVCVRACTLRTLCIGAVLLELFTASGGILCIPLQFHGVCS